MFSKILTFSILSVFSVLTAISSVYAHTPANPVYDGDLTHSHGSGRHTHENVVHWESGNLVDPGYAEYNRQGGGHTITPGKAPQTKTEVRLHEHLKPGWVHDDASHANILPPDPDPPQEDTNEMHSHSATHTHGGESHTHTRSHRHTSPHPHAHPSEWYSHFIQPNNQPPNNQPPNNQPPNNQPPNNQPTVTQPTVTQPTTVATGGTSEGVSSPQPAGPVVTGSAPPQTRPVSSLLQPLRVTEYMVRDWSKGGVIGNSNLPQWIELHNPNIEAVNLKGWTFQYATRRFRNQPYKVHTLTLAATEEGFSIPGGGVAILATQRLPARKFSGIEATEVYNLNIENVLKRGWVLTDAEGKEVQRLGREAFSALGDPVAPPHQDGARVSHHAYLSESPSESYYYGDSKDIGSPGFYEQPAPAAPSLIRPKRVGTWADLKR